MRGLDLSQTSSLSLSVGTKTTTSLSRRWSSQYHHFLLTNVFASSPRHDDCPRNHVKKQTDSSTRSTLDQFRPKTKNQPRCPCFCCRRLNNVMKKESPIAPPLSPTASSRWFPFAYPRSSAPRAVLEPRIRIRATKIPRG